MARKASTTASFTRASMAPKCYARTPTSRAGVCGRKPLSICCNASLCVCDRFTHTSVPTQVLCRTRPRSGGNSDALGAPRDVPRMELQEGCPGHNHVLTKQRILDYIPHLDSNILKLEGTEHYLPMCQECNNSYGASRDVCSCQVHHVLAGLVCVRAKKDVPKGSRSNRTCGAHPPNLYWPSLCGRGEV